MMDMCNWREIDDNWSHYWESECGLVWCFNEDSTPSENEMVYCPKCGKKISEHKFEFEQEEE
ncbi:hypothetical protein [Anaerosporobacter faecicola]|uniref:hypothetical protein n=1 Tax=Anaerosporobacter faecicola TaxID=2718714 RepID=UPI00143AE253|nr:hypothetical protein [Anaerosporobacter faecicola]